MKVLNLDSLSKNEGREVVLFGKTHQVKAMDVENFIETTRAAEQMGESATLVSQVEATIDMIKRSIPTVEVADLKKLSLEQLQAIVSFIRGEDVAGVESREEGSEGK